MMDMNDNKDNIIYLRSTKEKCEYRKGSCGRWTTGCKKAALGVNKFWRHCPYCGKSIIFLDNIRESK